MFDVEYGLFDKLCALTSVKTPIFLITLGNTKDLGYTMVHSNVESRLPNHVLKYKLWFE